MKNLDADARDEDSEEALRREEKRCGARRRNSGSFAMSEAKSGNDENKVGADAKQ